MSFFKATQKKKVIHDDRSDTFRPHERLSEELNDVTFESKDEIHEFKPDPDHLNGFEGGKDTQEEPSTSFMKMVKKNKKFHTSKQQARAKKARALSCFTECFSVKDFMHMMQSNLTKNDSVTMKDIKTAETICDKNVGILEGEITKQKAAFVIEDHTKTVKALMQQQHQVNLCADIMKIDEMCFSATVFKNIECRTCH